MTNWETPRPGLYQKFRVERIVGQDKPDEEFFVLSPTHDPMARVAIDLYAELAEQDGYAELARDLSDAMARVRRGERFRPHTEEVNDN